MMMMMMMMMMIIIIIKMSCKMLDSCLYARRQIHQAIRPNPNTGNRENL